MRREHSFKLNFTEMFEMYRIKKILESINVFAEKTCYRKFLRRFAFLIFLTLILIWRFSLATYVSFAPQSFLIRTSAYRLTG